MQAKLGVVDIIYHRMTNVHLYISSLYIPLYIPLDILDYGIDYGHNGHEFGIIDTIPFCH